MTGTQEFSSRTSIHESPIFGRVLEIELAGSDSHELSSEARQIFEQEISRHRPQLLVINLLAFDSPFGNDLLGALVAGATFIHRLGPGRQTRILAMGRTAGTLDRVLPLAKLDVLFGGKVYADLDSALREATGEQDEPAV